MHHCYCYLILQIAYTNRRMRGSIEAAVICHFLDSTKMECIWMLRAKGSPPWQVVSKSQICFAKTEHQMANIRHFSLVWGQEGNFAHDVTDYFVQDGLSLIKKCSFSDLLYHHILRRPTVDDSTFQCSRQLQKGCTLRTTNII